MNDKLDKYLKSARLVNDMEPLVPIDSIKLSADSIDIKQYKKIYRKSHKIGALKAMTGFLLTCLIIFFLLVIFKGSITIQLLKYIDNRFGTHILWHPSDDIMGNRLIILHPLELTDSELEKIGIVRNDSGYVCTFEYMDTVKSNEGLEKKGYHVSDNPVLVKELAMFTLQGGYFWICDYNGWSKDDYSQISPFAYSDSHYYIDGGNSQSLAIYTSCIPAFCRNNDTGISYLSDKLMKKIQTGFNMSDTVSMQKIMKKLVPIKITLGNKKLLDMKGKKKTNLFEYAELYIWYLPTKEFIDKLPVRYRERLIKELEVIEAIENGSTSISEACDKLKSDTTILDVCNSISAEINNSSVYPNPAVSYTNLKLNLALKGEYTITLYSMSGKQIRVVADKKAFDAGDNIINISLNGIGNGVYFIIASSERGDQITQKVFVE